MESDDVTVQIIMEVTVERDGADDAEIEAYVHDAVCDWFLDGTEYETKVKPQGDLWEIDKEELDKLMLFSGPLGDMAKAAVGFLMGFDVLVPHGPDHWGLTLEEAAIDTDEPDVPPAGWHICDCSEDCGAWEPDGE